MDVAEEGGVSEVGVDGVDVVQNLVFDVAVEHVIIFGAEVGRFQMRQDDGANSVDEISVKIVHLQNFLRDDGAGLVVDFSVEVVVVVELRNDVAPDGFHGFVEPESVVVQNAFAVFVGEDFAVVSLGDVVQGAGDLQFRGIAALAFTEFDAHGADAHGVVPGVVLPLESDAIVIP